MLVERDITFSFKSDQSLGFDNWVKCVRLEAIAWILKSKFGFRFQTAYLSITYFDRFLSKRSIENEKLWAVRLLSVACLSLAAKMEEIKAPALSEFHTEDYNFESKRSNLMDHRPSVIAAAATLMALDQSLKDKHWSEDGVSMLHSSPKTGNGES
ncbi:hypothetical protein GH714_004508 [Hevea brasiliensis]|uniref:B-like cyclin n=1 Tax=Hevea brasiliensis TaxID=3981 RepID=A0A6A6MB72_HEVBR|nr:hypothetical protein GH714_004508 [Hevea brasiliensis]